MLWLPKFDAREVIDAAAARDRDDGRADVLHAAARRARVRRAKPAATVRLFVSGSAPLLPETFDAFRARTGHAILERYGMTETGMITSNPLAGARVGGTVGPPLPGVDGAHRRRATARRARRARSAASRSGARTCSPATGACPTRRARNSRADGYFRTGDIGAWVDGTARGYLRLVGRAKDLIITGGLNVYPKEIEERIDAIDGVVESAVIGVPDPDFGEAVTAVVVAQAGTRADRARRSSRALKGEIATLQGAEARASSPTTCRATRWARCRRTCCASSTPARDSTPLRRRRVLASALQR